VTGSVRGALVLRLQQTGASFQTLYPIVSGQYWVSLDDPPTGWEFEVSATLLTAVSQDGTHAARPSEAPSVYVAGFTQG